jgi:hypothetical protein
MNDSIHLDFLSVVIMLGEHTKLHDRIGTQGANIVVVCIGEIPLPWVEVTDPKVLSPRLCYLGLR